jgi:hypothetical protein
VVLLTFDTSFVAANETSHFLVYWPDEQSVSVVKHKAIVPPFINKVEEEVKVRIGRRVIAGVLKFSGSIDDVLKAEKEMCIELHK